MSYAKEKLERDLERAYYKYFLRVGEPKGTEFKIAIHESAMESGLKIDTGNLQRKHLNVSIK